MLGAGANTGAVWVWGGEAQHYSSVIEAHRLYVEKLNQTSGYWNDVQLGDIKLPEGVTIYPMPLAGITSILDSLKVPLLTDKVEPYDAINRHLYAPLNAMIPGLAERESARHALNNDLQIFWNFLQLKMSSRLAPNFIEFIEKRGAVALTAYVGMLALQNYRSEALGEVLSKVLQLASQNLTHEEKLQAITAMTVEEKTRTIDALGAASDFVKNEQLAGYRYFDSADLGRAQATSGDAGSAAALLPNAVNP